MSNNVTDFLFAKYRFPYFRFAKYRFSFRFVSFRFVPFCFAKYSKPNWPNLRFEVFLLCRDIGIIENLSDPQTEGLLEGQRLHRAFMEVEVLIAYACCEFWKHL